MRLKYLEIDEIRAFLHDSPESPVFLRDDVEIREHKTPHGADIFVLIADGNYGVLGARFTGFRKRQYILLGDLQEFCAQSSMLGTFSQHCSRINDMEAARRQA